MHAVMENVLQRNFDNHGEIELPELLWKMLLQ